jgi:hypothetical protein
MSMFETVSEFLALLEYTDGIAGTAAIVAIVIWWRLRGRDW